ncbi:MAG: DUF4252 domain-containing protein [Bacteroidales bacterium]|nr:DUF4252 domain-containing protein [Bacteroidales bacterium]
MIRYILSIAAACAVCLASAGEIIGQTPVEKIIIKYSDVKGARYFIASGGKMVMARSLIRRTPLASIASEVEVLDVLKMQYASDEEIQDFDEDLKHALLSYEYYGKENSRNGTVDIYIIRSGAETIEELVIYNPAIHSLNSLKGTFSVNQLMEIPR